VKIPDHYAVLGVERDAAAPDIRAAYRALARSTHPDRGGSAELMVRLNAAWAVLGNPHKRAAYDRERAIARPETAIVEADPPATSSRELDAMAKPIHRRARPASGAGALVLDFGRYAGLPLGRIARTDPGYLEWLASVPVGRQIRGQIQSVLGELAGRRRAAAR
jgi:curved DNA-binding protein CbpA